MKYFFEIFNILFFKHNKNIIMRAFIQNNNKKDVCVFMSSLLIIVSLIVIIVVFGYLKTNNLEVFVAKYNGVNDFNTSTNNTSTSNNFTNNNVNTVTMCRNKKCEIIQVKTIDYVNVYPIESFDGYQITPLDRLYANEYILVGLDSGENTNDGENTNTIAYYGSQDFTKSYLTYLVRKWIIQVCFIIMILFETIVLGIPIYQTILYLKQ